MDSTRAPKPIVIVNIEVSENQSVEIKVYEGEDPLEIASTFCADFNLSENFIVPLTNTI